MNFDGIDFILASASPRRKELLAMLGLDFRIMPALGEEDEKAREPGRLVELLSRNKCLEVAERVLKREGFEGENKKLSHRVIIGSDTLVILDKKPLGKPKDRTEALEMIGMLQGRDHQVYTGVTLAMIDLGDDKITKVTSFHEKTVVHVSSMDHDEIEAYVDMGESMDKAGAYGIQGGFCKHIEGIEGDYFNVMGLPVARLYKELKLLC